MKMVEKRQAMLGGPQSEYLQRAQKGKINKLQNECNEEKNKVKAKREFLAALQFELEHLRLLSGMSDSEETADMESEKICS
jgi:hypothetical protein